MEDLKYENKILLDTIKLQQLFIESLYNIKQKDYYIALEKLEISYALFDNIINVIHPLSEIRNVIIDLRDKIEYNMKQIKFYVEEPSDKNLPVNDIIYDQELMDEISYDYDVTNQINVLTCFDTLYNKFNNLFYLNDKIKID